MNTQIQAIHFQAKDKLVELIEEKMHKLDTFHDGIVKKEIFLRLETGNAKANKIVEVKVALSGGSVFAKEKAANFEKAVFKVVEALRKQLRRHKNKRA